VDGEIVSKIGQGLVVLVGVGENATKEHLDYVVKKFLKLKLWPSDEGRPWSESVVSNNYEIILISQFTLFASLKKPKPSYLRAMNPTDAASFYQQVVDRTKELYEADRVFDGKFGAMMEVELVNDGPVTITLSKE